MSPLSKEEILAQLKKIGIRSNSEVDFYLKEYKKYSTMPNLKEFSPQEYEEVMVKNYPKHGHAVKRIFKAYHSFAPRIANTITSFKGKTLKRT